MDANVLKENISIWVWNKLKLALLLFCCHLCCSKWWISANLRHLGDFAVPTIAHVTAKRPKLLRFADIHHFEQHKWQKKSSKASLIRTQIEIITFNTFAPLSRLPVTATSYFMPDRPCQSNTGPDPTNGSGMNFKALDVPTTSSILKLLPVPYVVLVGSKETVAIPTSRRSSYKRHASESWDGNGRLQMRYAAN